MERRPYDTGLTDKQRETLWTLLVELFSRSIWAGHA